MNIGPLSALGLQGQLPAMAWALPASPGPHGAPRPAAHRERPLSAKGQRGRHPPPGRPQPPDATAPGKFISPKGSPEGHLEAGPFGAVDPGLSGLS